MNIDQWKYAFVILAGVSASGAACADGSGDPAVASSDNGKYADKDGNPTYKVGEDGVVDWYSYSGFRRYHSDCHVCHGPNGEGSSANDKVMPSFADNVNVMCFLDDIYVYLRARANNAVPGGRPPKHEDKPEAAKAAEASCTGIK